MWNGKNSFKKYSGLMKQWVGLFLFFFITKLLTSQIDISQYFLIKDTSQSKIQELREDFSKNKIYPKELELECLTALSFYPELKDAFIEFKWKSNLTSTMKTIPTFTSFFFGREVKYRIYFNQMAEKTGLKMGDLSFNAKVGWIGHELAHVTQCYKKSRIKIMRLGLNLLSKKFVAKHERDTDRITIKHNLGYALYEGTYYVFNSITVNEKYRKKLEKSYLSPTEILEAIQKL